MRNLILLGAALFASACTTGPSYPLPGAPDPVVRTPPAPAEPPAPVALMLSVSIGPTPVMTDGISHLSTIVTPTPTAVASYAWTFGDGQSETSSTGRTDHLYRRGTYQTRVVLTDGQGRTAEASVNVTASDPAQPAPPAPTPAPLPPTLSASLTCPDTTTLPATTPCNVAVSYNGKALASTAVSGVAWEWGDGSTIDASSTGPVKSHTYPQAGSYLIVATVSATTVDGSKQATTSRTVTVK